MDKVIKIMKEIETIAPEVTPHIHCLGYAINDVIDEWKQVADVLREELNKQRQG